MRVLYLAACIALCVSKAHALARSRPPIFIIGAMKAGTSALWDFLEKHPSIHPMMTFNGEPSWYNKGCDFFSTPNWRKGQEHYEARMTYQQLDDSFQVIDSSPSYLWSLLAPSRVQEMYGNASQKIIIVLRDPVDRAYSMWKQASMQLSAAHALKKSASEISPQWFYKVIGSFNNFADKAEEEMKSYDNCISQHFYESASGRWASCHPAFQDSLLLRGAYDEQIRIWRSHFPSHSFCIISHDLLLNDPVMAMQIVADFLTLSKFDWKNQLAGLKKPVVEEEQIDGQVRHRISEFIRRQGGEQYHLVKENGYLGCKSAAESMWDYLMGV